MDLRNSLPSNDTLPSGRTESLILGGIYVFITICGLFGNTIVILAVIFSKSLQTAFNAFVVNLAVADLLVCLSLPLVILSLWTEYQPYLDKICFIALLNIHTSVGCSIYTLASIAVNRLVLFVGPLNMKYYLAITKPGVLVLWITLLWTIPLFVSVFPPVVLNIGELAFDETPHICRSPSNLPTSELYNSLLVYAYYPVPLTVIFLSYTGISVQVYRHNRRLTKQSENVQLACSSNSSDPGDTNIMHRKPARAFTKVQLKITRNMFFIFAAFVVCLTPHAICNFTECKIESYTRQIISFNSMVNPILYGISHPHFRAFYGKVLRCKKRF